MKLYLVYLWQTFEVYDRDEVSNELYGVFDSKDKAEACVKSIIESDYYDKVLCWSRDSDVYIEEIELNKPLELKD